MSAPATVQSAADDLTSVVQDLRTAAEARVREYAGALKNEDLNALTGRAVQEASARWRELSVQTAEFIKENPGRAVLAALGIGFALGAMMRRD